MSFREEEEPDADHDHKDQHDDKYLRPELVEVAILQRIARLKGIACIVIVSLYSVSSP